jgi:hypothetical protein
MTARKPVRITKVRQVHAASAQHRPGVAYNGANLVAQRPESAKKNAARRTK